MVTEGECSRISYRPTAIQINASRVFADMQMTRDRWSVLVFLRVRKRYCTGHLWAMPHSKRMVNSVVRDVNYGRWFSITVAPCRTWGKTLQSWALGTICYAVSHACHCCSSMPIPVKWTSKHSDIPHNLKAWCRPTKHHKFSQKWNKWPYPTCFLSINSFELLPPI